jgi:LPXTG-site transpeptidase (sortase) family protein
MNSKYSNVLTVLLVIVIIAIIGIIGFLGYRYYRSSQIKSSSDDFVGSFLNDANDTDDNDENITDEDLFSGIEEGNAGGSSTGAKVKTYKGYVIAGTIEIPATNANYPIIAKSDYSKSALETSVVEIYGNGLNQVGNTTIVGHNYRNGLFFSNNKKLNIGDKIYITDLTGQRLAYTIYNKYEGSDTESDYMTRDTQGAKEISLSTCTDDSKARLIIWARAD